MPHSGAGRSHRDPGRSAQGVPLSRGLLLLLLLALLAMPGTALATTRTLRFDLVVNSTCANGRASDRVDVAVTWRDGDGSLKGKGVVHSDRDGAFRLCSPDHLIEAGDTLTGKVGSSRRTLTVPRLKIVLNRIHNTAGGRGPAGASVVIAITHTSGFESGSTERHEIDLPDDGRYLLGFTAGTTGGDWGSITWRSGTSASSHRVRRDIQMPFLGVWRGRSVFFGSAAPGTRVEVSVGLPTEVPTATTAVTAPPSGQLYGHFVDEDHHPVRVHARDVVSAPEISPDAQFGVLNVSGSTDTATDKVTGSCAESYLHYFIEAYSSNFRRYGFVTGKAGHTGTFSKDMTSRIDIRSGDTVNIMCRMTSGDQVGWMFVVP